MFTLENTFDYERKTKNCSEPTYDNEDEGDIHEHYDDDHDRLKTKLQENDDDNHNKVYDEYHGT